MKKTITLILLLITTGILSAQTVLHQDFSSPAWPPDGWTIMNQAGNWSRSQTNNAGGIAPEARLSWTPQFNGITRLVSPAIDLSGNTKILVKFRHNVDHYTATYQIGLATRSGGASGTWNNVWLQNVNGGIPAEEVLVVVENNDVNQTDFQIGFFFSGNSFNINYWYIDDIEVMLVANLDAAMASVDVPDFFAGVHDVSGSILNLGVTDINSMDVNWQLNTGVIHTTSYSGLNLQTGASYHFTSDQPIDVDPGTYQLKVWVSAVNGMPEDDVPENDTITKTISVVDQINLRKPLFEEFTSSTCPPCATFNNNVMNPFHDQFGHTITLIKYQMNWPGSGDPYYTVEGGVRRNYYGVNAVPMMFIEGANVATNWTAVNNAYNAALSSPAFIEINAQHTIEGDIITVNAEFYSHVNAPNVAAHIVVIENTTYGNVGTNGETSFKHVMMKMLPGANGTIVNLEAGVPLNLQYSHDMSTTFVEDMDDLSVVVFVQDNTNKSIFQSAYSEEVASFTFPGDANCDGVVNVLDVVAVVNHVLGNTPEPFCPENADVNEDGIINVLDIVGVVNIVLGGKKSADIPVKSLPASLIINESGLFLDSDGTLAGLQFEIEGLSAGNFTFMLEGYEFAFSENADKMIGLVFSFDNNPIPAGKIELLRFNKKENGLGLIDAIAANLNANEVEIRKFSSSFAVDLSEGFDMKAYPNPSKGIFLVEVALPFAGETNVTLFNLLGKEISTVKDGYLSRGNHIFRMNEKHDLPSGIYFVKLYSTSLESEDFVINRVIKVIISD